MKYVVVIPSINPENTSACLSTIDGEIKKNVYVVDNSVVNNGVARSWNLGIDRLKEIDGDYLIICSASMRFDGGMRDLIEELNNSNEYGVSTQHGWHLIALGRKTIDAVGKFDENLYPAYYEDTDYIRRMELLGIHEPLDGRTEIGYIKVSANSIMDAYAIKHGLRIDMSKSRDYFIKKWGDVYDFVNSTRGDMYDHPFNNKDNDINYFEIPNLNDQINDLK